MPEFHYLYTEENEDPAMRFESLLIHAFKGSHKWDDPLGVGAQDWYRNPIENPKAALTAAFGAIAYRFRETIDDDKKESLRELFLETKDAKEWPQLASIVSRGLALYHQL